MGFVKSNCKIILASSSKIRAKIMEDAGLEFKVEHPDFDEEIFKKDHPDLKVADLALELARNKALSISKSHKDSLVIGCDQICEVNGEKLDKSKDENDAIRQLMILSGKKHYQNNGVVIAKNGEIIFENLTKVELVMHELTKEQIISYVKKDQPIGCAGSYKYESLAKVLFSRVSGDHFSILGINIQQIISFLFKNNFIEL